MVPKRALLVALFGMLVLALTAGGALAQGESRAVTELEDADGNPIGNAEFVETPDGVAITVNAEGLAPGEKGIHIHETGSIEPDFEATGGHFNPTEGQHGFENPDGPHAGDLENIVISEDGAASYQTVNGMISLSSGQNPILDGDGASLVIHAEPDDYRTDPSGETGNRVAAGVIEPAGAAEELPATGGASLLLPGALMVLAGFAGLVISFSWRIQQCSRV